MTNSNTAKNSGIALLVAIFVMAVLHQDFWFWDDDSLVFGFMPVGLFYHAMYSIVAACLWVAAIKFAWPHHLEKMAEGEEGDNPDA